MELKVWVEGIQRIVCGVTVNTTCQDVVFALAHATGKVGRFTLIERWRNNERLLAPNENPLKLLIEWGEYANDVQFILQRSENKQQQQTTQQQQQTLRMENSVGNNTSNNNKNNNNTNPAAAVMLRKPLGLSNNNNNNNNSISSHSNSNSNNNNTNNSNYNQQQTKPLHLADLDTNLNISPHFDKTRELKKKSFGAHDAKLIENIGIVKGIPQRPNNNTANTNNSNIISNNQHRNVQLHKSSPTPTNSPLSPNSIRFSRSPISSTDNNNSSPLPQLIPRHEKSHSNPTEMSRSHTQNFSSNAGFFNSSPQTNEDSNNNNNIYQQIGSQNSKSINEINLAVVRESLDRRIAADSPDVLYATPHSKSFISGSGVSNNNNNNCSNSCSSSSSENLLDIYNGNVNRAGGVGVGGDIPPDLLYKNVPTISANGALVPPPYRDPPPPRNSPLQLQQQQPHQFHAQQMSAGGMGTVAVNNCMQDYNNSNDYDVEFQHLGGTGSTGSTGVGACSGGGGGGSGSVGSMEESESIFQATQYNDLMQLIKFQREKISAQQLELTKYDAEIVYLENKERDQAQELEAISREITKADQIFRQGSEQLQTLQYVEEENELVKQQEKTLKSEIALLRSKLANCETELLQCKNKIRLLMNDIEVEQRSNVTKQKTNRQNVERDFLMEMERIQSEIDQAIHNTDTSNKTAENLKKEILLIENAITEKKRQVEQLVNEMKEVNLQSLTVNTSEEIKHFLEGSNKPGSSRRIIGSPRQLENAVPTSKNPHGVWV
ncbi:PREDICTED: type-2 histone deacetylase 1 [Rhagoletis zephyria]|uniref:type-2 histone deacetylase 1 n=1 Tax=Rhagoletis zephyria TaxID=28612 RepID=UPI0008115628|nr:PREDICTED: type-2 histone deacetylase 1 [Rhagoletis zephyria]